MTDDTLPTVTAADAAYEAILELRDLTISFRSLPAPEVYSVLGNLKHAGGHALAETLRQLASGLERSLTDHDVYEDDGGDPAASVAAARAALQAAATKAAEIGTLLEVAQSAINQQGYRVS